MDWCTYLKVTFFVAMLCLQRIAMAGGSSSLYQRTKEGTELQTTKCSPWHHFNSTTSECECYHHITCEGKQAFIAYGHCLTYEESSQTSSYVLCPFLHHVIEDKSLGIRLPHNISELNSYMCGSRNRTGRVCSECVDGFGPSLSSIGYECSNCSDAWHGWSLYFLLEFGPITIFYFILLVFQVNFTSAPITTFTMYCQIVLFEMTISDGSTMRGLLAGEGLYFKLTQLIATFYGFWNLDFLWYIVPPFCISDRFKLMDILFIRQICTLYPFFLIFMTWVCIELHGQNFRPLVWLWNPLHKYIVHLRRGLNVDTKSDLVNVFSSLFLLSCSKFLYEAVLFATCHDISITNTTANKIESIMSVTEDLSVDCYSTKHIVYATVSFSITFIFVLLPVLILMLYPTKICRTCLAKCKLGGRTQTILFTFVEKFHGCYRDGLDGGKDMRSLSGIHFLVRIFCYAGWRMFLFLKLTHHGSFYKIIGLALVTILVAYIQPYKKSYMNIMEILLLSYTTFLYIIHREVPTEYVMVTTILPILTFFAIVSIRLISEILKRVKMICKSRCADTDITASDSHQHLIQTSAHYSSYGSTQLNSQS